MFGQEKRNDDLFFLKTGNYLIHFRGYFKSKKKLKIRLTEILDQSYKDLIEEWEKKNDMIWNKRPEEIISNDDICHSVEIIKVQPTQHNFFKRFFAVY